MSFFEEIQVSTTEMQGGLQKTLCLLLLDYLTPCMPAEDPASRDLQARWCLQEGNTGHTHLDFKTCYRATITKMVWYQPKET